MLGVLPLGALGLQATMLCDGAFMGHKAHLNFSAAY